MTNAELAVLSQKRIDLTPDELARKAEYIVTVLPHGVAEEWYPTPESGDALYIPDTLMEHIFRRRAGLRYGVSETTVQRLSGPCCLPAGASRGA